MPDWHAIVRSRLGAFAIPQDRLAETTEELSQHLEEVFGEAVSAGASEEEALQAALEQLAECGELAREIDSQRRRPARLELGRADGGKATLFGGLMQDIRFGLRLLAKEPGFTVTAAVILALGIGLNTSVFSVVNAVLLKPLPVSEPEELVRVYSTAPGDTFLEHQPMAYPDFRDIEERNTSFGGLAVHTLTPLAIEQGDESVFVLGEAASGNYFATLGLRPAVGRLLEPDDDREGTPGSVLVLSHAAWTRRYGRDPGVLGQQIRVNGQLLTVVGVGPVGFEGMSTGIAAEAWIPLQLMRQIKAPATMSFDAAETSNLHRLDDRGSRWLWAVGRREAGVSLEQARAELAVLGDQLESEYMDTNERRDFLVLKATDVRILPDLDGALFGSSVVLMGLVGLVLLIASANVANMLLARATARRREIAVRLSIGASRGRLLRQLLTESLLLALLGGGLALLLAVWSNRWLNGIELPIPVQLALGLSLDWRVLGFTFAVSTLTAVVAGLLPALRTTRQDLSAVLKEESGTAAGPSRRGAGRSLVVAQVALSSLLLVSAGLSMRSLLNAQSIDPGFDSSGVVVAHVHPRLQGYSATQSRDFFLRLLQRVRSLPGVEHAAVASHVLLSFELHTEGVVKEADAELPRTEWPAFDTATVGPRYFEVLRVPLLRGRAFTEQDGSGSPLVAIVNEELATRFWPGEDPVGQRLLVGADGVYEVVGVVGNGKYRTLGEPTRPFLYRAPWQAAERANTLMVRVAGSPEIALGAIRGAVRELDPKVPVSGLQTLEETVSTSLLLPRASAGLFATFGLLGLVLSAVGLYGIIALAVSERIREIGLRVAMGARRRDIVGLVLRRGMGLTVIGLGLGLAGAAGLTRLLSAILYGVSATDAITFVGVALFILVVSLGASYLPARRAARLDPASALRHH